MKHTIEHGYSVVVASLRLGGFLYSYQFTRLKCLLHPTSHCPNSSTTNSCGANCLRVWGDQLHRHRFPPSTSTDFRRRSQQDGSCSGAPVLRCLPSAVMSHHLVLTRGQVYAGLPVKEAGACAFAVAWRLFQPLK